MSTSIAIKFNGISFESFKPSRGLRQGDPISHFLFNMCINSLSDEIKSESIRGNWKGLTFNNQNINLSHMAFVDDIVLFGEAILDNVQTMLRVVGSFCDLSGQKINFLKFQVICSIT